MLPDFGRHGDALRIRVFRRPSGSIAFHGAAEYRIASEGDTLHVYYRLRGCGAAVIAGVLGKRPFHFIGSRIGGYGSFNDDLGMRQHQEIAGFTLYQLERLILDAAQYVKFGIPVMLNRAERQEFHQGFRAINTGNRHFFRPVLPLRVMNAPMLRTGQKRPDFVPPIEHTPIHTHVLQPRFRVARHGRVESIDVASPIPTVPVGYRNLIKIDVVSFKNILLDRTGRHYFGRQASPDPIAVSFDKLLGRRVPVQSQQQRQAFVIPEPGSHDPFAPGVLVVLYVLEKQCRPPQRT